MLRSQKRIVGESWEVDLIEHQHQALTKKEGEASKDFVKKQSEGREENQRRMLKQNSKEENFKGKLMVNSIECFREVELGKNCQVLCKFVISRNSGRTISMVEEFIF